LVCLQHASLIVKGRQLSNKMLSISIDTIVRFLNSFQFYMRATGFKKHHMALAAAAAAASSGTQSGKDGSMTSRNRRASADNSDRNMNNMNGVTSITNKNQQKQQHGQRGSSGGHLSIAVQSDKGGVNGPEQTLPVVAALR
jgi:hypothetical protein